MHRFWIKTCNLILVVALLFGYQAVVQSRAQKETIAELEYELQQKTVSGQPEEADEPFFSRVPLPCAVKPHCGESFGLTASQRYRICRTKNELIAAFRGKRGYGVSGCCQCRH